MYELNNFKKQKSFRRRLRIEQTKPEGLLWWKLRRRQLGYKFRRQHGFGSFILDFYCSELKFAIEVDGDIHNKEFKIIQDHKKDKFLEENNIILMRVTNYKVLDNVDSVATEIQISCDKISKSQTPPLPPLDRGRTC